MMKRFIIGIVSAFIFMNLPVEAVTYEDYQSWLLLQQAKDWQDRVSKSPAKVNKWVYGQKDDKVFGVKIDRIDNKIIIKDVLENSYADRNEIKPGMEITEVRPLSIEGSSLWGIGKELSFYDYDHKYYIEIGGKKCEKNGSFGYKNENYFEIYPKVYLDLASMNFRNGAVFFWLKFLNGNKLIPIESKQVYYFENAYVIDCVNNRYATIEINAVDYNKKEILHKSADSNDIQKVKDAGYKPGILGYDPKADYSEIKYEEIPEDTPIYFLKEIMDAFLLKSKEYKGYLDFQATFRYF